MGKGGILPREILSIVDETRLLVMLDEVPSG